MPGRCDHDHLTGAPSWAVDVADSIDWLARQPENSACLVYLDPPYATGRRFAARNAGGFDDSPRWDDATETDLEAARTESPAAGRAVDAVVSAVGRSPEAAHVARLSARLVLARRILRPTGTLWVHCDWRIQHLVRLVLDTVSADEGGELVNHVAWCYRSGGAGKTRLSRKHDDIVGYSKTSNWLFTVPREPYPHDYGNRPGFHPDGRVMVDWWDVPILSTSANERTGWPTQKPQQLLERLISAFTVPGCVVADPYCGSGTTLAAAKALGRRSVGCDISEDAVAVAKQRLTSTLV